MKKLTTVLAIIFGMLNFADGAENAELMRRFELLLKEAHECNVQNVELLKQALKNGKMPGKAQREELLVRTGEQKREAGAIKNEMERAHIDISHTPEGLKLLSEFRRAALTQTAEFRKIWYVLQERGIAPSEASVAHEWGLICYDISDDALRHADTDRRIREFAGEITALCDNIRRLLGRINSVEDANAMSDELSRLYERLTLIYFIVNEYKMGDPQGAQKALYEVGRVTESAVNHELVPAEQQIMAKPFYSKTILSKILLMARLEQEEMKPRP